MDSEACTPTMSPTSPSSLKDTNIADYYRIAIMAESPVDNNEMITSFSNPNYTLNNADALNSNSLPPNHTQYYEPEDNSSTSDVYETIHSTTSKEASKTNHGLNNQKYGQQGDGSHSTDNINSYNTYNFITSPVESEGHYSMDSTATTPAEHAESIVSVEHTETDDESPYAETKSSGFLGYYSNFQEKSDEKSGLLVKEDTKKGEEVPTVKTPLLKGDHMSRLQVESLDPSKDINSPGGDSNDSGIQADASHVRGPVNDDLYAVVDKKNVTAKPKVDERKTDDTELPPGWEKHQDENGPYYWHIKSGTIQREPPPPPSPSIAKQSKNAVSKTSTNVPSTEVPETPSEQLLHQFEGHALNYASESLKSLQSSSKQEKSKEEYPIRFAVRSLGWVEIAEEDLTPERSSKAVNKCIVDLSLGRNDINDVVGRWGDGKDLYMDLDDENLTLSDPTDMSLLNVQPIHSIRVWGVGRDNGRDFAYVARDRVSRKHMCHVFRCDTPARQIANTLRDICKKIMMERSLQQGMQAMSTAHKTSPSSNASRPNNLPNLEKLGQANGQKITFQDLIKNTSFPTPMEEPKKVLRCHYLGELIVGKPTGIDTINSAMEKVYARVPPETWHFASVAVAPSTITVTEHSNPENVLTECRVRFLSFMGIAQRNVRLCSFIMHTAQDEYVAHVFHCEPSAGALCKTIEAACKLRYQKCIDAHHKQMQNAKLQQASQQQSKGFLKSVFGSMSRGKKVKS